MTAATERTEITSIDVKRLRDDFPILSQTVHGKPLVYLDNAATAQKPRSVIEAVSRYYAEENSNVHRGVHRLSELATAAYEGAREKVRAFLGAASTREVVFVRGCTEGINLVAGSFGRQHVGHGDEVLITGLEHHSNIVPWQMLCEQQGARLVVVPIDDHGDVPLEEFVRRLSPRTKLAAISHVSNALGTVLPVKAMVERAHDAEGEVPSLRAAEAAAEAHAREEVDPEGDLRLRRGRRRRGRDLRSLDQLGRRMRELFGGLGLRLRLGTGLDAEHREDLPRLVAHQVRDHQADRGRRPGGVVNPERRPGDHRLVGQATNGQQRLPTGPAKQPAQHDR